MSLPSSAAPAPDAVCALALGAVLGEFRQSLAAQLPTALHAADPTLTWSLVTAPDSTDGLWDAVAAQATPPWTTLVVTSELYGSLSLAQTLVNIRQHWPSVRIAVMVSQLTAETRQLIATCAAHRIYNVLLGRDLTAANIAAAVTRDGRWEDLQPYLTEAVTVPLASAAPAPAPPAAAPPAAEPMPTYTVAVVSGKGGVGKTGLIANLLTVTGPWNTMAVDLDYIKPSLPLYFHEANEAPALDLRRLLTQIQAHHRPTLGSAPVAVIDTLTDDDRRDIQQYVDQAEVVAPGARVVPGASRFETVMPLPPTAVMAAILEACQRHARFVFIDTPGVPTDPLWISSVRAADFVAIVTTPEYAVLLETIDLVRKLDLLQVPREKRGLIVNKRAKWGYPTAAIRRTHLPGPAFLGEVPYDPVRWERSLQQHRPLALDHPKPWRTLFEAITHVKPERTAPRWRRTRPSAS